MKAILYPTVHGILILDKNMVQKDLLFKDLNLNELAQQYLNIQKGEIPQILRDSIENLQSQEITEYLSEIPALCSSISKIDGIRGIICDDYPLLQSIQKNIIQYLMDSKIQFSAKNLTERSKVLSEIMIKSEIAETATQGDFQIKQAIDTIVDLDKSINFFSGRLREWYGLHFPELTDKMVADNIQFAELVAKIGLRNEFTIEILQNNFHFPEHRAKLIAERAQRSMGGALSDQDIKTIQALAQQILNLKEYHDSLEDYISTTMNTIAPNLKAVLGSAITGKMISIAGSLERLALMSSSTIQILGAEKALFKAMKAGKNTPKYGILFQWNKIRGEKSYLRGKIARMVAGKVSILAKVDFYKGEFIGDKYKENIDRKIELIKKQFPKPPAEPKRETYKDKGRGRSRRDSSRSSSRGSYKDSSRSQSRGFSKGSSRSSSRGSSRDLSRGSSRGPSRSYSRDQGKKSNYPSKNYGNKRGSQGKKGDYKPRDSRKSHRSD